MKDTKQQKMKTRNSTRNGKKLLSRNGNKMDFPGRGEIWLVSLEPIVGHEIGKTRSALVISNDRNNQFAETITVLPITSNVKKIYPFETFTPKIKSNQIRTVDKKRLIKLIGNVSEEKLKEVKQALSIHLNFAP